MDFEEGSFCSLVGVTEALLVGVLFRSILPRGLVELSCCFWAGNLVLTALGRFGVLVEVWLRYIWVCLVGVIESGSFSLETSPAVFLYYLRKSVMLRK